MYHAIWLIYAHCKCCDAIVRWFCCVSPLYASKVLLDTDTDYDNTLWRNLIPPHCCPPSSSILPSFILNTALLRLLHYWFIHDSLYFTIVYLTRKPNEAIYHTEVTLLSDIRLPQLTPTHWSLFFSFLFILLSYPSFFHKHPLWFPFFQNRLISSTWLFLLPFYPWMKFNCKIDWNSK